MQYNTFINAYRSICFTHNKTADNNTTIAYNNFQYPGKPGSTYYDIYNISNRPINAQRNWWGASTTAEMNTHGFPYNITKIYDVNDTFSAGMVDYRNWLSAPVAPEATASPSPLDFGPVRIGQNTDRSVRITNTGTKSLNLFSYTITNAAYTLLGPVFPQTGLAPQSWIDLNLRFSPSSSGLIQGQLRLDTNDTDSTPYVVQLLGIGDGTAPSIPVITTNGAWTNNNTSLHFFWSSTDPESGITDFQYCVGTTSGGTEIQNWTSVGSVTDVTIPELSLINGTIYYISGKAKNGVDLWSLTGVSNGVAFDGLAPVGTVQINSGAAYTRSTSVSLILAASDAGGSGVAEMRFSNDDVVWSTWESYSGSRTWTLSSGDGLKTVYVQYRDGADNESSIFSSPITLDTIAPLGTLSINNGAAYTSFNAVSLILSATDSGSGVAEMRFSNDDVVWNTWESYTGSKTWTLSSGDGFKTVYVQYRDGAGNESSIFSSTITLDLKQAHLLIPCQEPARRAAETC